MSANCLMLKFMVKVYDDEENDYLRKLFQAECSNVQLLYIWYL